MSVDTVRRYVDALWSEGRLEIVDELAAENYVDSSPGLPPELPPGREGQKAFARMFREAFPDIKATIEEALEAGDKVVIRWRARGTHEGEFMGTPASGKSVSMTGVTIYRLAGGKIAEEWTYGDMIGLLQQIGAMPAQAQASA